MMLLRLPLRGVIWAYSLMTSLCIELSRLRQITLLCKMILIRYRLLPLLSISTSIRPNAGPCWYLESVRSRVHLLLFCLMVLSWLRFPATNILELLLLQIFPGLLTSLIFVIRPEDLLECCISIFTRIPITHFAEIVFSFCQASPWVLFACLESFT